MRLGAKRKNEAVKKTAHFLTSRELYGKIHKNEDGKE